MAPAPAGSSARVRGPALPVPDRSVRAGRAACGRIAVEPRDEAPSAAQLAQGQQQLVVARMERQVQRVVVRAHDAEEPRIPKALRAPPSIEDAAVEEYAHLVAVAERE